MVGKLTKLIEDEVGRVFAHIVARVVNLFDIALGARRANRVAWVACPFIQPVEPLLRHAGWQHGHTTSTHDLADGHTTARIVASRRPNRAVIRGVKLPRNNARGKNCVGREHLVRGDHREAVAEHDDDWALDAS